MVPTRSTYETSYKKGVIHTATATLNNTDSLSDKTITAKGITANVYHGKSTKKSSQNTRIFAKESSIVATVDEIVADSADSLYVST